MVYKEQVRYTSPVLVVEDDATVREAICWTLQDEGLPVQVAEDGQRALDWLAQHRPSLLVLDMGLPVVDGYGVAEGLRDLHGGQVPILLMTADGRAAEKAARVGATAYLHKPFDVDRLAALVRTILATPPGGDRPGATGLSD